jgi:hypothetical protein
MRSFKDSQGREWRIEINISAIKKLRDVFKVDLLKVTSSKETLAFITDPIQVIDMIYILCEQQCKEAGVSEEDFGRAMAGDVLDNAAAAFLEELVAFFPNAQRRPLSQALGKIDEMQQAASRLATERMQALNIDEMLKAIPASGDWSMKLPEPSESTRPD